MPYEEIASYESVFNDIKLVLEQGRRHAVAHVNHEMLVTYWNIGRVIVEHEQTNPNRAEYGAATLKRLSRELTEEYGKGFSRSNLQNMRLLYLDQLNLPDTVWQIELVPLLRAFDHFRSR